ncbi:MAG TPA: LamG-like jellyroll fold domain-containing protein, partial [Tepidisphaeraceae bacterium]|nr:LamG-like jellyroll fold domain-containing protein [Tepidisphaeraceae bacterium]
FYNDSKFDGQNGSSNLTDRTAIASDKRPLFPGQTASFANYTSYANGLTGIIIDVADMSVLPRIDDLEFRVGNDSNVAGWTQAPTPLFINTYPGRGVDGSTQVTIIWDEHAIQNQWLEVRVLAQPHLNLAHDTVFYFGNAIGDTGDSASDAVVTSNDAARVSANAAASAGVTNLYDINRDGAVNATDASLVSAHLTDPSTALKLISLGSAPTVATAAGAAPSPVTGATATLSARGADDAGEAGLTYTWALVGTPPAPVLFSDNGTHAARDTVATFMMAGSYHFRVTIADALGFSVTSDAIVQVNPVATSIAVEPPAPALAANTAGAFTATQLDQFGNPTAVQPTFAWSVASGGGHVTSAGAYTAPRAAGAATIRADAGGLFGTASVTIAYDALAWYPADATSGAALADSSGNNLNATLTGAYSFGGGVSGNALNLTGGHATLPQNLLGSLNDFTVATWVRLTAHQQWARIFDFGSGAAVNMFLTETSGAGALRFAITTTGGGGEQRVDGPVLPLNAWTHLAVTLSGNTATLYVNGAAYASNNAMTLHPTNLGATTQNYLGKSQYPDPALQGSIDDFRIYSRALAAGEVAMLAGPSVVTPAAAFATTVTGTSAALSVLGHDVTAGEPALTYTWAATGAPPAPVSFTANGTNGGKNTTATFTKAGTYSFQVTIANPGGRSVTSSVTVTVVQTPAGFGVTPGAATVEAGLTVALSAAVLDQFGAAMATSNAATTWAVTAGAGTVRPSGVFTAPAAAGTVTVTASAPGVGSGSATLTVTNNLRAWFPADGAAGATLTDSSGQNRDGTLTAPYAYEPGVAGNALNLAGGGAASLPNGIVSGLNDFTIATWIKIANLQNWARVFDFGTGTNAYMFLTPRSDAGTLRFAITTAGNGSEQRLNGPAIAANAWTHVAVTLTGNTGRLYVNGALVATNNAMTVHPTALGSTTRNYLGDSQFAPDPSLQGSIDDFRIYARALSAAEVTNLTGQRLAYVLNNRLHVDLGGAAVSLAVAGGNVTVTSPAETLSFAASSFADILVSGTAGDDVLTLAATMPKPMTFAGGTGSDALNVAAGASHTLGADASAGTSSLALRVDGSLVFESTQHLASLTVNGTATLAADGDRVLHVGTLAVAGTLDLADNALIVSSGTLGSWTGSSYGGLTGLVATGRNGAAWNGNGIVTSRPAAQGESAIATLGVSPSGGGVMVRFTYVGDADLNGRVDGDDYFVIDSHVNATKGTPDAWGWHHGDFNFDGRIDGDDYFLIDRNIGRQGVVQ